MHKEELQVWNGHLQRLITEMQEGIAAECFVSTSSHIQLDCDVSRGETVRALT